MTAEEQMAISKRQGVEDVYLLTGDIYGVDVEGDWRVHRDLVEFMKTLGYEHWNWYFIYTPDGGVDDPYYATHEFRKLQ